MIRFTITKLVKGSPEHVFEVFTDIEKSAERITGVERIEMLTEGPVGKGTRFRETRIMFKKEATEEMEITEFEPGKRVTIEADSCGAHFTSTFAFTREGDHVRVDLEFRTRATSFFAILFAPIGWLMMGTMKKAIEKDMDELKAAAETG